MIRNEQEMINKCMDPKIKAEMVNLFSKVDHKTTFVQYDIPGLTVLVKEYLNNKVEVQTKLREIEIKIEEKILEEEVPKGIAPVFFNGIASVVYTTQV